MCGGVLMQTKIFNVIRTLLFLTMFCFWFSGCGDDEPLGLYTTDVTFTDNGAATLTIDTFFTNPCPGTTDPEPYTPVLANITLKVAAGLPGLTIQGYTLAYVPLPSEDGTHTLVMPPTLDSPLTGGTDSITVPSGSSTTFSITCFSIGQKDEYRALTTLGGSEARYIFQITLHCIDEFYDERDIVIQRTVYLGAYDNC